MCVEQIICMRTHEMTGNENDAHAKYDKVLAQMTSFPSLLITHILLPNAYAHFPFFPLTNPPSLPPSPPYLERHNVVGLLVPRFVHHPVRPLPQVPAPILLNLLIPIGGGSRGAWKGGREGMSLRGSVGSRGERREREKRLLPIHWLPVRALPQHP